MSSLRNRFCLSGFLLVTTLLAACGGGGSDPSTPPPPPPPPPSGGGPGGGAGGSASSTYLFYTDSSGSLSAVDAASPASPVTVESGSDLPMSGFAALETFLAGTYNSATQTVTNIHRHALMYTKTDGKFYKVSALKSGSLTPVQVSSESATNQLCGGIGGDASMDLANPDNSQYVYALPGSDGRCDTGDDVWKMVRLGMSASDVPVAAKPPVMWLGYSSTEAIAGWLVHEAGALKKCDVNFAACSTVALVTSKVYQIEYQIESLGSNRHLLHIGNQYFVYDANANTLSAPVFTRPAASIYSSISPAADGTHLYFAHDKTIYKAPVNGSAVASVLAMESDHIGGIALTANKVVYITGAQLKVADKTSGATTLLATNSNANRADIASVNGSNIYYNLTATGGNPIVAGVIDEAGGNKSETAGAAWNGMISPTSGDLNKSDSLGFQPEKMIRIEGYDALGSGKGFAGGTLKTFDAVTRAAGVTLGTLPTDNQGDNFSCYGFGSGDNVLCSGGFTITPAPSPPALSIQNDIFFINVATANSLTRVTNTASKNEMPLF